MNKVELFDEVNELVSDNLPDIKLKLHRIVEKLFYEEDRIISPHQLFDFTYECEQSGIRGYLTVHTLIDGDEFYFKLSFERDTFTEPLDQKMRFEPDWKEVNGYFKDYLRSWESLESENFNSPSVKSTLDSLRELTDPESDRFQFNQILLWSILCDWYSEDSDELDKVYETYEDYSHRVKSLPSKVESSFIDESDMLVSFMKEQIRNGNFEEWVGKQ